ncbi:hypothetical protein ACJ41O_011010 [Fusarium nematophilum]
MLESDLDDIMVQDAIALLLFPKVDPPEDYRTRLFDHLDSWSQQQLPNPLKQHDHSGIRALDNLHSWLIAFVEDYLTKATAVYPPREYICLSNAAGLMFRDQIIGDTFDAAHLTAVEGRRFLRAFLRHELIYRSRHPPGQCHLTDQDWERLYLADHFGRGRQDALFRYGDQPFQSWDREALQCVYQYLGSLYAAIFAQCSDSWLPDIPSDALSFQPRGLLFPDNLLVDFNAYASDFDLWGRTRGYTSDPDPRTDTRRNGTCIGWQGLNLAAFLLRWMRTGRQGRDRAAEWLAVSSRCGWFTIPCMWSNGGPMKGIRFGQGAPSSSEKSFERGPGLYASMYPRLRSTGSMQLETFRQRAWAFLDNDRLYSPSDKVSVFPSRLEIQELRLQTQYRIMTGLGTRRLLAHHVGHRNGTRLERRLTADESNMTRTPTYPGPGRRRLYHSH